jgi:transcriptional regulator with XRE-family HTH domain
MLESTQNRSARPRRRRIPNRLLKELRINAGLSPNDLAYRAGISGNTVRMAESGFIPTPRVQFAIARVFDRTPLDLWPLDQQRAA